MTTTTDSTGNVYNGEWPTWIVLLPKGFRAP